MVKSLEGLHVYRLPYSDLPRSMLCAFLHKTKGHKSKKREFILNEAVGSASCRSTRRSIQLLLRLATLANRSYSYLLAPYLPPEAINERGLDGRGGQDGGGNHKQQR